MAGYGSASSLYTSLINLGFGEYEYKGKKIKEYNPKTTTTWTDSYGHKHTGTGFNSNRIVQIVNILLKKGLIANDGNRIKLGSVKKNGNITDISIYPDKAANGGVVGKNRSLMDLIYCR